MLNTEDKKLKVINTQTGEIECETNYVITEEQLRERKEREAKGREVHRERNEYYKDPRKFVINFIEPIREVMHDLTLTQAGVMMKVLPYTQKYGKLKSNGKPLTIKDISKVIKRAEKATRRSLAELEDIGLIVSEGRPKTYTVNPLYHLTNKVKDRKNARFVKLYKSKAKELLDRLSLVEAGLVYKMIPYFHYETFILCGNPNEDNPELYEELGQNDLARLIGYDEEELKKLMRRLRTKGIILQTDSSYIKSHYVHPDLFYRMDRETEKAKQLRDMFESNELRKQARRARRGRKNATNTD
ncbi:hypothetical protein [Aquibacillus albus]|uniref:Transcriptional regulator n=1 Tax=Aquibacillus albus TaxID=1168171 RepID=A0ABS2N669_9BACI|nr:hypothetical protein [Aquibacillus albus]MBM7573636.1 putative transcriptional regulator [Aquibacillus albus]